MTVQDVLRPNLKPLPRRLPRKRIFQRTKICRWCGVLARGTYTQLSDLVRSAYVDRCSCSLSTGRRWQESIKACSELVSFRNVTGSKALDHSYAPALGKDSLHLSDVWEHDVVLWFVALH